MILFIKHQGTYQLFKKSPDEDALLKGLVSFDLKFLVSPHLKFRKGTKNQLISMY
jgi:hypothetical protein